MPLALSMESQRLTELQSCRRRLMMEEQLETGQRRPKPQLSRQLSASLPSLNIASGLLPPPPPAKGEDYMRGMPAYMSARRCEASRNVHLVSLFYGSFPSHFPAGVTANSNELGCNGG